MGTEDFCGVWWNFIKAPPTVSSPRWCSRCLSLIATGLAIVGGKKCLAGRTTSAKSFSSSSHILFASSASHPSSSRTFRSRTSLSASFAQQFAVRRSNSKSRRFRDGVEIVVREVPRERRQGIRAKSSSSFVFVFFFFFLSSSFLSSSSKCCCSSLWCSMWPTKNIKL